LPKDAILNASTIDAFRDKFWRICSAGGSSFEAEISVVSVATNTSSCWLDIFAVCNFFSSFASIRYPSSNLGRQ